MALHIKSRIVDLSSLLVLPVISSFFLVFTLISHPLLFILDRSKFCDAWFSAFWARMGPKMATNATLLAPISSTLSSARGITLELGPGAGDQAFHYKPALKAGQITHMYGGEPNRGLHDKLLLNAKEAGFGSEEYGMVPYTALECGAEPESLLPALQKAGLLPMDWKAGSEGIFDTIITCKSLCSMPQKYLPDTLLVFQALLKPGGQYLFLEHVANSYDKGAETIQTVLGLVWPVFLGGCRLDGPLERYAKRMGGWSSVEVGGIEGQGEWEVIRFVKGVCRK
ncbi:MAG: hypothetical protein M1834_003287 [Cirrosporium novae-zelandiae]|nr:MAG: hypothetical protein M1834_003287 [Cirrosporium novae-zelandiae]